MLVTLTVANLSLPKRENKLNRLQETDKSSVHERVPGYCGPLVGDVGITSLEHCTTVSHPANAPPG